MEGIASSHFHGLKLLFLDLLVGCGICLATWSRKERYKHQSHCDGFVFLLVSWYICAWMLDDVAKGSRGVLLGHAIPRWTRGMTYLTQHAVQACGGIFSCVISCHVTRFLCVCVENGLLDHDSEGIASSHVHGLKLLFLTLLYGSCTGL